MMTSRSSHDETSHPADKSTKKIDGSHKKIGFWSFALGLDLWRGMQFWCPFPPSLSSISRQFGLVV